MIDLLNRLKYLLDKRDQKILIGFLALLISSSFLEVLGIGVVIPFVALLNDSTLVNSNRYFGYIYNYAGFTSYVNFMIAIGCFMACLFILKNTFLIAVLSIQTKFMSAIHRKIGKRLFASYLFASYVSSFKRNTAQQLRNITIISAIVHGILTPAVVIVTELLITLVILVVLLKASPGSALLVASALLITGATFYHLLKDKLKSLGLSLNTNSENMMKTLNQSLGSFKETKIYQCEQFFQEQFVRNLDGVVAALRLQSFWSQTPRLYIETVLVCLVSGIMIAMLVQGLTSKDILISLSLFAGSAIRLLPSLNRISSSLNTIRFYIPSLHEVFDDIKSSESYKEVSALSQKSIIPHFEKEICLEKVCFSYSPELPILKNVSLTIKKNEFIGFAGNSGAGKTTLVDVICGLIPLKSGRMMVDGVDVCDDLEGWRRCVSYIPQRIYLLDDTIRNNVGFGIESENIDDERVWAALRLAQIDKFVSSLSGGLYAGLGENGARISGGQRQRIGIARALYHDPEVLVMDEATSALDNETEKSFMEALSNLAGKLTIIIIAHRLSTLKKCDVIYMVNEGEIVEAGNFECLFPPVKARDKEPHKNGEQRL
ncbi:MAG: ABC transporter ATP-binding protein [Deltaproteobacteria bacterium]|nr:ABC transporter ATP-binding protein [Deltaproteobacteria bacterium]